MTLVVLGALLSGAGCASEPTATSSTPAVTETVTATVTETVTETPTPTPSDPSPEAVETHLLRGTLQVTVNRNPQFPENCIGFDEEGYGDIRVGQQVVVSGPDGETVGVGTLESCRFWPLESAEQARGIEFAFTVNDVPEEPFLTVAIGTGNRGEVTKSLEELRESGWKISLTL